MKYTSKQGIVQKHTTLALDESVIHCLSLEELSVVVHVTVFMVAVQLVFPRIEVPPPFVVWHEQLWGKVGLCCSVTSLLFNIFSPFGSRYRATI